MAEIEVFANLIRDSANFKRQADEYRKQGELEGALINYLMSAQALNTAKEFNYKTSEKWRELQGDKAIVAWCEDKCSELDAVMAELLGHIRPLQEELRRRKLMYAQRGKEDEDDESDLKCDNIRNLVFKGGNCITFKDIAGLDSVKRDIETAFVYPLLYPRLYPKVAKGLLFYGPPGTGKCCSPDTPIVMFSGRIKQAKDVIVGDWLMGDDSMPRIVMSTCRGRDQMFKIVPKKGDSYTVNQPHILTLKNNRKPRVQFSSEGGRYRVEWWTHGQLRTKHFPIRNDHVEEAREKADELCASLIKNWVPDVVDIPLNEYQKRSKQFKHCYKTYHVPIKFEPKVVEFDPYILGYLLGMDKKEDLSVNNNNENSLKQQLYQIIKNKRVPHDYKCNSRTVRLHLLAGFIDAKGHWDTNGRGYEIVEKRKELLDDVMFVARSLGFACDNTTHKLYYQTLIYGKGLEEIPVKVQRKRKQRHIKDPLVSSFKIEALGEGEYCGFTLTGNGRFLLGDFTVTHNTLITKASVNELQQKDPNLQVLFFNPTASDLKGKYVGETEKNIVRYFKCASKHASECQQVGRDPVEGNPKLKTISIIFFDEFEAIAGDRAKDETGMMTNSVNTLLQMLDGIKAYPNVSVIAATNLPWGLDSAILRRFTKKVMVDLPDQTSIETIIRLEIDKYIRMEAKEFREQVIEETSPFQKKEEIVCGSLCDEERLKRKRRLQEAKGKQKECLDAIQGKKFLMDQERYKKYISIEDTEIKAIAAQLHKKLYSASDVNRVMAQALVYVGERARKHGQFYNVRLTDKNCEDIPGDLYMSTLSRPKDETQPLIDLRFIDIPDIKNIIYQPDQNEPEKEHTFVHSIWHTSPLITKYVADDSISDFYIYPEPNAIKDEIQVLFPIPNITVTIGKQETTADVYVYSIYSEMEPSRFQNLLYYVSFGFLKSESDSNFLDKRFIENIISFDEIADEPEIVAQERSWERNFTHFDLDTIDDNLITYIVTMLKTRKLTLNNIDAEVEQKFFETKNLVQLIADTFPRRQVAGEPRRKPYVVTTGNAIFTGPILPTYADIIEVVINNNVMRFDRETGREVTVDDNNIMQPVPNGQTVQIIDVKKDNNRAEVRLSGTDKSVQGIVKQAIDDPGDNRHKLGDKARAITFDIRQADLVKAISEIQSTIKDEELAELRKYRSNPSAYKPKKSK